MKVALVGSHAPGFVLFRRRLAEALAARGHSVLAVLPRPVDDETRCAVELGGARWIGYTLVRSSVAPIQDLRAALELASIFRRERVDCVLCYNPKPMIWGSIAAGLAGVRRTIVLVTGRGSLLMGEASVLRSTYVVLLRFALARADQIVFQNNDDRVLFSSLSIAPHVPASRVMGSGIDLDQFAYHAPKRSSEFVFLFVGRLIVDKGIREFVAAAKQVRNEVPDARFRIAGPLDSNPSAVARAELDEWAAQGIVEYVGAPTDVREIIAAASVLVLPSYAEGMPRVVLEAMALGRCVVTTDAPGCRDTVEDGISGRLVAPKSVPDLVAALCDVARDPRKAEAMGIAARARAEALFNVEEVNRQMIGAIEGSVLPKPL